MYSGTSFEKGMVEKASCSDIWAATAAAASHAVYLYSAIIGPADICCHNPLFTEKEREKKKKKKEGKYLD
jgi:hypothetical protein